MFGWFNKKNDSPSYSLLRAVPSRGLPEDLCKEEGSEAYQERRDRIQAELFEQPIHPDQPVATMLKRGEGFLHLRMPDPSDKCLPLFSTALRAADYAETLLPKQRFQYLCSTATQVVSLLTFLRREAGVSHVVWDRCPRCDVATVISSESLCNPEKVLDVGRIFKATEIARHHLYLEYALTAARRGDAEKARDVTLELVGHVTMESPSVHLLIGKLAVRLGDRVLLREAKDFLLFLKRSDLVDDLGRMQKTKDLVF